MTSVLTGINEEVYHRFIHPPAVSPHGGLVIYKPHMAAEWSAVDAGAAGIFNVFKTLFWNDGIVFSEDDAGLDTDFA